MISDKMIEYEDQKLKKWEEAKLSLRGLIENKYFLFAESHESYETEGIVEIQLTDRKQNGYPNNYNCIIKGDPYTFLYMLTTGNVIDEENDIELQLYYWVRQWSIGMEGDSYSGYLLLPMMDGRFWKIKYSC